MTMLKALREGHRLGQKHTVADQPSFSAGVTLSTRPMAVILPLAMILLAMTTVMIALPVIADMAGRSPQAALLRILDFRQEANFPTLFSTAILAFAAVLLGLSGHAAATQDRDAVMARRWYGLAAVFAFLAVDESAMIHEGLNSLHLGLAGNYAIVDKFPWVWFYGAGVIVVFLVYVPFLLRLSYTTAVIFIAAGTIYVAGAIGLEVYGAYLLDVDHIRRDNIAYILRGAAEEFCEMSGTLLFIWGLLRHLRQRGLHLTIGFGGAGGPGGSRTN